MIMRALSAIISTVLIGLMPHMVEQLAEISPSVAVVTVSVQRMPGTPILDFTRPWPVIPGATIRIVELNQTVTANAGGEANLFLPLGPTGEAVYTFEVSVPGSKFRSVTRRRVYLGGSNFSLFFDPTRDFLLDYTKEEKRSNQHGRLFGLGGPSVAQRPHVVLISA